MLLNCIILGATTFFIFYRADKLGVVDEATTRISEIDKVLSDGLSRLYS